MDVDVGVRKCILFPRAAVKVAVTGVCVPWGALMPRVLVCLCGTIVVIFCFMSSALYPAGRNVTTVHC